MSPSRLGLAALALPTALGLAAMTSVRVPKSEADPRFVRGVALGLFATDPEWDYGPLVEEIRARGASDVLLTVPLYQRDRFASVVTLREGHSPSLRTLARTLEQVRHAGMRAAVMPIVRLELRHPHEWRGVLTPAAGPQAWFEGYQRAVAPLLTAAERAGAQRFFVGSELISLEPFDAHWRVLIQDFRTRFSGRLSYSANWDHFESVSFWDALDEVGVTGYFSLQRAEQEPGRRALSRAWREPREALAALRRRVGRPVVITEIGYASQTGAARHPWNDVASRAVDLSLQAKLLEAFCRSFYDTPAVDGFYVWNWFGFGGPRDAGYSLRGKPAASVLGACLELPWSRPDNERSGA